MSHTDEPVESTLHELQTSLLVAVLRHHFANRPDVLVASDLGLYYRPEQKDDISTVLSPDVMVVLGAQPKPHRQVWATWLEGGRLPSFVVELLSHSTERHDLGPKRDIYEQVLRVPELVHYHPMRPTSLVLHRLVGGRYVPHPLPLHHRPGSPALLQCRTLDLWLGTWKGSWAGLLHEWLRFFHQDGSLALLAEEDAEQRALAEAQRADAEARLRAEETQRADAEAQRADAEARLRAEETQRADALQRQLDALLAARDPSRST